MVQRINGKYLYAGFIILPLEIPGLPASITVHGEVLRLQPEFHISLVGVKYLAPEITDKLVELFTEFTKTHDITLDHFIDDFRYTTKDDRAAVFVRCEATNVPELFDYLRQGTGHNLETPPTHVTLYARPGKGIRGIGVINAAQLAASEPVAPDVVADVRKALGL